MGYIISSKVENYFVGTVSQMYIIKKFIQPMFAPENALNL